MGKVFESEFHKGVTVAVVDSGDYQYQQLAPLFNEYGYGFVAPDQKLIFIDGDQSTSTQKIVEAHEVGHIVFNHTGIIGPNDEAEADRLTIEFKKRHGYSYNHAQNKRNKIKVLTTIFVNQTI